MRIIHDEPKRQRNIEKHGLDFADLTLDFFATAIIYPGKHGRMIAVGRTKSTALTVVFARLGNEAVSVISMRPSSRKERTR